MGKKEEIIYNLLNIPYQKDSKFYEKNLKAQKRVELSPKHFVYVGDIESRLISGAVIKVMEFWVKVWDIALSVKSISHDRKEEIKKTVRYISYKEYMQAFGKAEKLQGERINYNYSVKEGREIPKTSNYTYEKKDLSFPFRHWKDRNEFIRSYSRDEAGYYKLLLETKTPIKAYFSQRLPFIVHESDLARHGYIRGKTGSGKSEFLKLLIYSILINKKASIVIIEPHGDLSEQVARWKEFKEDKSKDRLIYINPYLKNEFTPSINPFELKEKSEINVLTLTEQLILAFEGLLGKDFTSNMQGVLKYCIPVLLIHGGCSLIDLKRFVTDGDNDDLIELGVKSENRQAKDFFINDFQSKKLDSTKSSLSMRLATLLASPVFTRLLTGSDSFDFEEAVNSGKVIIFNLSKGTLGKDTSNAYGRFVVAMVQFFAFKRASIPEDERPNTYLFIDEFQNYICKDMKEILAETRKYKLYMILANQYLKQIDQDTQNAILENTQVKVFGRSDEDDLKNFKAGEFLIRSSVNGGEAVRVFTPDFLVQHKNSMKLEDWKIVRNSQLEKYYKEIKQEEPKEESVVGLIEEIKQNQQGIIIAKEDKRKKKLIDFEPNLETDFDF